MTDHNNGKDGRDLFNEEGFLMDDPFAGILSDDMAALFNHDESSDPFAAFNLEKKDSTSSAVKEEDLFGFSDLPNSGGSAADYMGEDSFGLSNTDKEDGFITDPEDDLLGGSSFTEKESRTEITGQSPVPDPLPESKDSAAHISQALPIDTERDSSMGTTSDCMEDGQENHAAAEGGSGITWSIKESQENGTVQKKEKKEKQKYEFHKKRQETEHKDVQPGGPGRISAGKNNRYNRPLAVKKPVKYSKIFFYFVILVLFGSVFRATLNSSETGSESDSGDEYFDGNSDYYEQEITQERPLTEYGQDYSSFYSDKYIVTTDKSNDHMYREICVINNEAFIGTGSEPVQTPTYFEQRADTFRYTMMEPMAVSKLNTGYTVMYAAPDSFKDSIKFSDLEMDIADLSIPAVSDRNTFFRLASEYLEYNGYLYDYDIYDYWADGLNTITTEDGHVVTYKELHYKDHAWQEILDVIAYEERPDGFAFLSEYRIPAEKYRDGKEAVNALYSMLTFYTDDFETIEASKQTFPCAFIYSKDGNRMVWIDFSDQKDLLSSANPRKEEAVFRFGPANGRPSLKTQNYRNYRIYFTDGSSLQDGSFADYIDRRLTGLDEDALIDNVAEEAREEFSIDVGDVFYLQYRMTGKEEEADQLYRVCEYLIETEEFGELKMELEYSGEIPEDFDPEEFLLSHFKWF